MSKKFFKNRRIIIISILVLILILISIFIFKYYSSNTNWWIWNSWLTITGSVIETDFTYSGTVEDLFWGLLTLKKYDWSEKDYILNHDSLLIWIDWNKITVNDIKKWFTIVISGKNIDKAQVIKKLTIINEVNIIINSPIDSQEITSPIIIKWEARVYENTINYTISDSSWKVLGQWIWTTNSLNSSRFWIFTIKANYRKSTTKTGSIEVFEASEKDGSIINSTKVNIIFWKVSNWISL